MNKQRKVLITITYNEMGIIIDTKAEEVAQQNLQPTCNQLATDTISRQAAIDALSYCQTYLFDSRDHDKKISLEDAEYALEQLQPAQPEQQSCKYAERKSGTEQMIMMRYLRKE